MKNARKYAAVLAFFLIVSLCSCGTGVQISGTDLSVSQKESHTQELLDQAEQAVKRADYAEAIALCTQAEAESPDEIAVYLCRGKAHLLSGDTYANLEAAEADFTKALEIDKTNVDAWKGRIDHAIALECLNDALAIRAQNWILLECLDMDEEEYGAICELIKELLTKSYNLDFDTYKNSEYELIKELLTKNYNLNFDTYKNSELYQDMMTYMENNPVDMTEEQFKCYLNILEAAFRVLFYGHNDEYVLEAYDRYISLAELTCGNFQEAEQLIEEAIAATGNETFSNRYYSQNTGQIVRDSMNRTRRRYYNMDWPDPAFFECTFSAYTVSSACTTGEIQSLFNGQVLGYTQPLPEYDETGRRVSQVEAGMQLVGNPSESGYHINHLYDKGQSRRTFAYEGNSRIPKEERYYVTDYEYGLNDALSNISEYNEFGTQIRFTSYDVYGADQTKVSSVSIAQLNENGRIIGHEMYDGDGNLLEKITY